MASYRKEKIACILGNLLDHYDTALYGLLAPFLAPLFFENSDPLMALIMAYGVLPLGFIARPLGALFFGWMGDFIGRREALSLSLLGVSFCTFSMAFLPLYKEVGLLAPVLLVLLRMTQSFFAAGESSGGAIYLLEKTEAKGRDLMGSLFDGSTVGGILVASMAVAFFIPGGGETRWRLLFLAGGLTALVALLLRQLDPCSRASSERPPSMIEALIGRKWAFFRLTIASGFSHITYYFSFIFLQGFLPEVTSFSTIDLVMWQPLLLALDLILLPFFGLFASQYGGKRVMQGGVVGTLATGALFFLQVKRASFEEIVLFQALFVLFGVAFAAPYRSWALRQVPASSRYRLLSLAGTIGGQWIGAPTVAISLWLFREAGLFGASLWLLLFGGMTLLVLGSGQERCEEVVELNAN